MPSPTKDISAALFDAQEKLQQLELKKNERNPHFKNQYITLDAALDLIIPVLRENDILVTQIPYETSTGDLGLETTLYHVPSATSLVGQMPLNKLQKDDPQGQGSAMTYGRRYSIMSILMLVADEDDDGNAARSKPARKSRTKKEEPAAPASGEDESW